MGKTVKSYKKQEDRMQTKVNSLGKELKHDEWMIEHVKDENRELRQLEHDLEKHQKAIEQEAHDIHESWGSDGLNEKK